LQAKNDGIHFFYESPCMRRFFFALSLVALFSVPLTNASAQETEETTAASPAPTATPTPPFNRLEWREIGPAVAGGRLTSVVGSATDPLLYFIGAAGAGVWKTTNGGATWAPLFDKQSVSSIGALALDPKNNDVIWAGTGETNPRNDVSYGDGIYKSTDGGKTWVHMGLRETMQISSIAIDPRSTDTVIVGAMGDFFGDSEARGIYRTTDGGKTWAKTLYVGPQSGVSDLAVNPANPDEMYAGIWQFQRMPWTFKSGGPDDGLYKSIDGGVTWKKLTGNGLPAGMTGRIGLAIAPSDPKRVYATIEAKDGILWRSDDAGATWTMISDDTLVNQRPFYFSHLAVDSKNPDHVYGVSNELAESKDGGKHFKITADGVHVDYHSMWIAPNDPKRMIAGEDGGYGLTVDGGKNWSFSRNLAIGQVYHVGYSDEIPYRVCAPLQDNNGFCGPSDSLNSQGISDDAWDRVIGGDGMWAVPDPRDTNLVWTDLQDGHVSIFDRKTRRNTSIQPFYGTAADEFNLGSAKYRFNWDSPIAFAPWNPRIGWYGGNVVFQTSDKGAHWTAISPDLTRNNKDHQKPSGGPLALDVSGAEFSDTILDIEGSTKHVGEIWVGTDDGVVQVTLDGGKHWKNVTPPGVPEYGRVEIVAPSSLVDGTAYAVIDRHMSGDRTAYAFVTHDHGAHWTAISAGLPLGQEARSIRPDTKNPHLVYLGLENSLWASYDDGAHWQSMNFNLPQVAIYDIRVQPRFNDLLIATHGRALWIFDDLTPVQMLPQAKAAGAMLFPIRDSYQFGLHADDEGLYTRFAGKNPQRGAVMAFYQATPGAKAPEIEILDAQHKHVRWIRGTNRVNEKEVPIVTNLAGVNRIAWDYHEDGPVRWDGAPKDEYKGPRTGVGRNPGSYVARITLGEKSFEQPFVVKADPRVTTSRGEYVAAYAFAKKHMDEFSAIDVALNRIDAVIKSSKTPATIARSHALRDRLTADFHNGEDSLQRPGRLREDMQGLTGGRGGSSAPNAAQLEAAARIDAEYASVMRDVNAFLAGNLALESPH